jgi:hypothetical protein
MVAAELITRGRNIPGTQHRRDASSPFFQWTQSQDTNLASYVVDGLHWLLPEDLHCMVPNWPHPRTSPILGWDILIDFHFLWIYLLYSILFIKIGSILQMSLTKKTYFSGFRPMTVHSDRTSFCWSFFPTKSSFEHTYVLWFRIRQDICDTGSQIANLRSVRKYDTGWKLRHGYPWEQNALYSICYSAGVLHLHYTPESRMFYFLIRLFI